MSLIFYPHAEDIQKGTIAEKIEALMEGAQRYRAVILDAANKSGSEDTTRKAISPRDITISFNWEEIARILREVRDMPEISRSEKAKKADYLTKLSEVYEVLRGAKMSKLEGVRLALIMEANQLRGNSPQVV